MIQLLLEHKKTKKLSMISLQIWLKTTLILLNDKKGTWDFIFIGKLVLLKIQSLLIS